MVSAAQFSQVTGQDFSTRKSAQSAASWGFGTYGPATIVPFISKSNVPCPAIEKISSGDHRNHIADCDNLSAMALRRLYPAEATSHRNMLNRQERKGAIIHPDFRELKSFLRAMGPCPANKATLDRIDNSDPEYAPGKVRWADKRTQNGNKGDTLVFHDPATGRTFTSSQLAKMHGCSPDTIRKQRTRSGWTDAEIIQGYRSIQPSSPAPRSSRPSPSVPVRPPVETAKERDFRQLATAYREHRELYGAEALPADYETCRETREEFGMSFTPDDYAAYFRRLWPDHRHHVNLDNVTPDQMHWIARTDPAFVTAWQASKDTKRAIKSLL